MTAIDSKTFRRDAFCDVTPFVNSWRHLVILNNIIKQSFVIHKQCPCLGATPFNPLVVYRMMTSSNGNILCVTGHLCGEFTGHRWIPHTKASEAELWCFLSSALRLNKQLSKQSWGWWFETLSRPLWRHCHCNEMIHYQLFYSQRSIGSVAWISNYIHGFLWHVITHACPNFNGGFVWVCLSIHALNPPMAVIMMTS